MVEIKTECRFGDDNLSSFDNLNYKKICLCSFDFYIQNTARVIEVKAGFKLVNTRFFKDPRFQ